jgi:hypothetical protein
MPWLTLYQSYRMICDHSVTIKGLSARLDESKNSISYKDSSSFPKSYNFRILYEDVVISLLK